MTAPVDPADTIPSASPLRTSLAATAIDESFFSLMAVAGSSAISMTSEA